MRSISDKEQLSLKAATRRALDMAGGQDAFQHMTRVKQAALSKYGSPAEDCADKYMPIDVAVEADMEAGTPLTHSATSGASGDPSPISVNDALRIANEVADVVKAITKALENDGRVDCAEGREIAREIDEAVQALMDVAKRAVVRA